MSGSHFNKGDEVEVTTEDGRTNATWYPATVLRSPAKNKDQIYVEYKTLTSDSNGSKPLREHINVTNVRPVPPPELHRFFKVGENVDAFYEKGWRRGTVADILENSRYLVKVDGMGEEIAIEQCHSRLHREWDDGSWVPPLEGQKTSSELEVKSRRVKLKIKFSKKTLGPKFSQGTKVEVSSDEEGYRGSWYTAIIMGSVGNDRFLVEYLTLKTDDETKPLIEVAYEQYIRPYPPKVLQVDHFKLHEEVDAWYNDGWWVGVISRILDSCNYVVYFSSTDEELEFEHSKLRPHQDWIDGKWVIASKEKSSEFMVNSRELKLIMEGSGRKLEAKFGKGTMVEVKSDVEGFEGSWFTAIIVDSIGSDRFLVEYQTLRTDDETELLKEEADASCIRPCPPIIQRVDHFKLLEKVDAWYNDGWWVGLIYKVFCDLKYAVYFSTTKEVLEFDHSNLRTHQEWIDGKWVVASKV
ncbi:hypothetical protein L1049_016453 [Liquidambar formosana]|uniref:Agenet domain-containing protein n=1 Tax=Liquidambar formosana TaxID=63359 RepID=A0AAP0X6U8_LIQFO